VKTKCQFSTILGFKEKKGFLPNPRGPLSSKISSAAIVSANSEVAKVIEKMNNNSSMVSGRSKNGKKRRIYSPKERADIGKLACSVGATEAARHFMRTLGYTINESMVRCFKQAYLTEQH